MDQEVPHAGTPMAVPINFRFMRSSVDTDASIRIPMRRAADHRSDNKGSPMDGHTKCPHGTSGCKHVCDVHSCVTSWSCNYIQNPAHTLACRLGMALADAALCPMVSFRRGSWIVSRVVLPCGPGCQTTMSHGSTHGLIREHTRWRPDLSTCTVVFAGTNGSLRNNSLGCFCANLLVVSTDPKVHGRKGIPCALAQPASQHRMA